MTEMSLTSRILDAIPSGNYAFCALLKLLDIVETTTVPTAAVECRKFPRLLVNPEFVEAHAPTTEKLLMLILHELNHILLGHTTLFPHTTDADNIVFDAVINSMLCRMYPDVAHTSFFTDFYETEGFPSCLLRPPAGWPKHPRRPKGLSSETLGKEHSDRAWSVLQHLYSPAGATYEEVMELLKALSKKLQLGTVPLIGSHGGEFSPISNWEAVDSEVFEAIRRIVEDWDMPPDPLRGRSWNDCASNFVLEARRERSQKRALVELIQKVGKRSKDSRARSQTESYVDAMTVFSTNDRRHAVQVLCGFDSLLYQDCVRMQSRSDASWKVHLYIDVSGSMDGYIEAIYGASVLCRDMLEPHIHLFSTKVFDVTKSELRRGVCHSTYGTDIGCVAEHIRKHHVKNAVVVTDGFVGTPAGVDAEALNSVKLGVAYVGYSNNYDLNPFTDCSIFLQ